MFDARHTWFLVGATAVGKTAVGLELARLLDAEIVSLDSMAVYRGLDIGTAKPTPAERNAVRHHLVDILEPAQPFSLAEYVAAARQVCAEIEGRARQALFVGGTPLYLKAMLRGIFEGPRADLARRQALESQARQQGGHWLHEQLASVDPVAAARLHPNDTRRLVRALEVYEKTGRPISEWQSAKGGFDLGGPAELHNVFVLDRPRSELVERIDRRVEAMFAAGLVGEVSGLLARGGVLGRTARQALGYREVLEHLSGERGLEETIELVKLRTRQFARRQLTWFRSLSECRWLPIEGQIDPADVARRIAAREKEGGS
ncbi:MAG: tRNA (adenosine(37)-N6)-dimethylallyltransferase MiaA [Pirellulales bacterium]